jgi:hypothetical protein
MHPDMRSTTAPHREHTFQPFSEMTLDAATSSSDDGGHGFSISRLIVAYLLISAEFVRHAASKPDAKGSLQQRTGTNVLFVNAWL